MCKDEDESLWLRVGTLGHVASVSRRTMVALQGSAECSVVYTSTRVAFGASVRRNTIEHRM